MRAAMSCRSRTSSRVPCRPSLGPLLAAMTMWLTVCSPNLSMAQATSVAQEEPEASLTRGIQARLGVAGVYDDNVYWTARPTADFIWRITPELTVRHKSPRVTLLGSYAFDAERFAQYQSLSDPLARQTALFDASINPSSTLTLEMNAGYQSTSTAADLNVATGLASVRLPASEWHAGSRLTRSAGPKTEMALEYAFSRGLHAIGDIVSHTVDVRLTRRMSARDQGHLLAESRWFQFPTDSPIRSQIAVLGWSRRATPTVTVNLEGGPRYTAGSVRPELSAAIRHVSGSRQMSASYALTQATALGVDRIIDVRRAQAELAYRPRDTFQVALLGAVFSNSTQRSVSRVYHFSAVLTRPIARRLSLELDYSRDVQGPGLEVGESDGALRRNTVSGRFVFYHNPSGPS